MYVCLKMSERRVPPSSSSGACVCLVMVIKILVPLCHPMTSAFLFRGESYPTQEVVAPFLALMG